MKNLFYTAAVAAACVATHANAEAFNGGYAGGVVGYDKLSVEASSGGASVSVSGDGVAGGLVLGYNAKVGGSFVVGGEIEGVIGGGKITDGTDSVKTDYSATAGIRAGVLASSNILIFGKLAYARTQFSFDDESESGDGFAFGGGVEFALSDRVTARLAYTRTSYSIDDDAQAALGADVDINRDQVLAGVAFHF